ncbi:MAG TPA: LysR family transcriptional regulator [Rhizomicrobium sp.]|nr:LysR family transcriptional regulator [Rhizomicrobium sp.]
MHNWDDLRIFLAVARHRSFQGASESVGADATTISRRIDRLEDALKSSLFKRGVDGQTLTAAGKRLVEAASRVELANEELIESVGASTKAGRVRLSTSEGFGTAILSPAVAELVTQTPPIEIEIVANPGFLSAAIREVDLAITLAAPQDKRLAVEHLTDYRLGLYASAAYLARRGTPSRPSDLADHTLVGYIDDLIYANELRYLDEIHPSLAPSVTSSSIRSQLEMVRAGVGIAVLPCFMAETVQPELTRLLRRSATITRTFWMSARRDVQQTTRVRRVRNWVRGTVADRRNLILTR